MRLNFKARERKGISWRMPKELHGTIREGVRVQLPSRPAPIWQTRKPKACAGRPPDVSSLLSPGHENETTQEECLWDYIGYQPVRIRQRLAITCPPSDDLKGISRRMPKELHGSKIGKKGERVRLPSRQRPDGKRASQKPVRGGPPNVSSLLSPGPPFKGA